MIEIDQSRQPMLTTIDNPYDPHEEYDKWYEWDVDNGYHTSSYLARLVDYDFETFNEKAIDEKRLLAIWEIVMMDDSNTYVVV